MKPTVQVIAGIRMRELTPDERTRSFSKPAAKLDLAPYLAVIREMEGDTAYAIGLNGSTARTIKVRLNKAAKRLDLKLRWVRPAKDAGEIICELQP